MNYQEIEANKDISKFVKLFWQFDNTNKEEKRYTVLPDGYFDLVIRISKNKIIDVTIYGIWLKQMDVIIPNDSIVIGVTFKPISAEYIFTNQISEIVNDLKILDNTFQGIDKLSLNNFKSFVLEYSKNINTNIKFDNRKVEVFNILHENYGVITVEELSNKVFWKSRQINRYFNSTFGLSVKTYANILRCSISFKDIEKGKLSPSLSFYDQSHFIKEIKKHSGSNPKELHQNKNDRFLQFSTLHKL